MLIDSVYYISKQECMYGGQGLIAGQIASSDVQPIVVSWMGMVSFVFAYSTIPNKPAVGGAYEYNNFHT
jgi:hypothetical protein